jgi:hypothetical protein
MPARLTSTHTTPSGLVAASHRAWLSLALVCMILGGCAGNQDNIPESEPMPERTIQEVQEAYTPEWMELEAVVGTGIGQCEGEPCIRVFLAHHSPEAESAIPSQLHGYRVELEVTGPFRPR